MPTRHSLFAMLLAVATVAAVSPPSATAVDDPNSIELAIGSGDSTGGHSGVESLALRFTHRFNDRWGLQVAYQRGLVDDFADDEELQISARLRLYANDRLELFSFLGGGILRYEEPFYNFDPAANTVVTAGTRHDETHTVHLGVGAEIALRGNLYFRPDIVYRRSNHVLGSRYVDSTEFSVAIGYRF